MPDAYLRQLRSYRPSISSFIVWLGLNRALDENSAGYNTAVISGRGPEASYHAGQQGNMDQVDYTVCAYDHLFPGYSRPGTATLMIMGSVCTRACRFCAVDTGNPRGWLDAEEPANAARSVQIMGLRYVVITSVDRDELRDGGAGHFVACIHAVREANPETRIEVLVPGTPVSALGEFVDGIGLVSHRGARWNAECDTPVVGGQRLWITGRRGLVLKVSAEQPPQGR
jgi:hypothetical protein